jgi:hypothetical protein
VGEIFDAIFGFFPPLGAFIDGLGQLLQSLGGLLRSLVSFLQTIWNFLIKRIVGGILSELRAAAKWLEDHLQPLIDAIRQEQQVLQRLFNTYIRPILIFLQRVRAFVHILALLHIGIAQRLDAYLTNLQNKLLQGFYTITAALNTLTNILLALQDPTYLIKHPVLLLSIRRQIPALIQAVTGRPPGYWFPSPKGAAGGVFAPPPKTFTYAAPGTIAPASSMLANDGLPADLGAVVNCYEYAPTAVDQVQPLDYFNADLYPATLCPYDDAAKCLLYSWGVNV